VISQLIMKPTLGGLWMLFTTHTTINENESIG